MKSSIETSCVFRCAGIIVLLLKTTGIVQRPWRAARSYCWALHAYVITPDVLSSGDEQFFSVCFNPLLFYSKWGKDFQTKLWARSKRTWSHRHLEPTDATLWSWRGVCVIVIEWQQHRLPIWTHVRRSGFSVKCFCSPSVVGEQFLETAECEALSPACYFLGICKTAETSQLKRSKLWGH